MRVILGLPTVGVGQAGEAALLHANAEVGALDLGRRDLLHRGLAHHPLFDRARADGGDVAARPVCVRHAVGLHEGASSTPFQPNAFRPP